MTRKGRFFLERARAPVGKGGRHRRVHPGERVSAFSHSFELSETVRRKGEINAVGSFARCGDQGKAVARARRAIRSAKPARPRALFGRKAKFHRWPPRVPASFWRVEPWRCIGSLSYCRQIDFRNSRATSTSSPALVLARSRLMVIRPQSGASRNF